MTIIRYRDVLAAFLLLLSTACSFAPITPRYDAASVGRGEFVIESNVGPTPSLSTTYGATDDLDIGLEIEQVFMGTAWARYSFINNPSGFSLAGNAAVFRASGESLSNGWYAGVLASQQVNRRFRLTAGVRYAQVDYQYGNPNQFDTWLEFDNPDDGSVNGQVDLTLSFLIRSHIEFSMGVACQRHLKNTDARINDELCLPSFGFTFYRL